MENQKTNGVLSNGTIPHEKSSIEDSEKSFAGGLVSCFKGNALTLLTLLAVIVGIGLGFGLRSSRSWTPREVMYLNYPGEMFLRMLRCLILPLIVSSLVSALGGLDTKLSGKIGLRAVVYYLSTTVLAIILGIILVVAIKPGAGDSMSHKTDASSKSKPSLTEDTLMDLVRNMFPPNIIEAAVYQYSTELIEPNKELEVKNDTNSTMFENNSTVSENNSTINQEPDYRSWAFKGKMGGGTNILGIVVFSVVLGITLGKMKTAGEPLLSVFRSLSDAMMIITNAVIWLSPIGVLFLVASKIVEMDDLAVIAGQVGLYTVTVLVGLFIHGLITLPLLYFFFVRRLPFTFMGNMMQAIATAFGTSSSSATLPITIACLEEKNGIDHRVSRFCLPVGATINMDGTALYEAVAAIFIAQVRKVPLSIGNIIAISITSTAASVGAAGIPQAGLVTMVMVLNVIGLPAEDAALVFVVDWFLDRFRTAINVLGDAFGAGIVAKLSVKDLDSLESLDSNTPTTTVEMTTF